MANSKSLFKGMVAVLLVLLTVFLLPVNIIGTTADAAAKKTLYVKELKLYIKDGAELEDVQKWCDDQKENKDSDSTNDWHVIDGDLNDGAAGTFKSDMDVYLCYKTTDDPSKAVRDMAVMNEKGNYSEGAYETLLKEQKDVFNDIVSDMKEMLEEYRANYKNKVPVAVKAHDFLNGYIEDDSKKLLGDLLLDISDEDLAEVLLQANGKVVLTVQRQIASACDTKKTTWLDRMEKLGSFSKLRKQYIKAYNNNTSKADKALDKEYHDKALALADIWEDLYIHVKNAKKFIDQYGLAEMTKEEFQKWMENNSGDDQEFAKLEELSILQALEKYKYGDSSLLVYFNRSEEDIRANLKELYPLAASLSEGQFCALNETVSLFGLAQDAMGADIYNNYESSKTNKMKEDLSSSEENTLDDMVKLVDDKVDEWADGEKTSIYEGVDRDIFKGGVAVTSNAETYSNGAESTWADHFVDGGGFKKCVLGLGISSAISAVFAYGFKCITELSIKWGTETVFGKLHAGMDEVVAEMGLNRSTYDYCRLCPSLREMERRIVYGHNDEAIAAMADIQNAHVSKSFNYALHRGFKIGVSIFAILLAVADITMTVITLYKYYNRDHLPIPHHMVDLSYNEDKETSYIVYKNVLNTSGKYGDLNGGVGKQWLALYATTDEDAGDPIIAPTEDADAIKVIYGKTKAPEGASPLHYFGKPNTAQNLTFADGESGWSYNDEMGGTYLYFKRDANAVLPDDTATTTSDGNIILFLGLGLLAGLILGIGGTIFITKKKKNN